MITETQIRDIRNFLVSKKLQSDLFLEVQDHFISQISQLMIAKNIGFEEAFLQTKILWMGELRMVKASIFSFKKITVIERKIVDKRLHRILLNSLMILPLVFVLNFLIPDSGIFIQIFLFSILFLLVGLSFFQKKLKFREYLFLGFHPLILKILVVGYLLPFLLLPLLTANFSTIGVATFFKNSILISSIVGVTQIQLLYLNFKNKKVLL